MSLAIQLQIIFENILYRKLFLNEDPYPIFIVALTSWVNRNQMKLINYYGMDFGDENENLAMIINRLYGQSYTGLMALEQEEDRALVTEELRRSYSEYLWSRRELYQQSPEFQFSRLHEVSVPQAQDSGSSRTKRRKYQ